MRFKKRKKKLHIFTYKRFLIFYHIFIVMVMQCLFPLSEVEHILYYHNNEVSHYIIH